MMDPTLDRAARLLGASDHITMGVAELSSRLGYRPTEAAALAQRLRNDGRFIVLDRGALPGLDRWPEERRASYAAALGQADLLGPCLVLLRPADQQPGHRGPLTDLLHGSVLTLASSDHAAALTFAAQRTRDALAALNRRTCYEDDALAGAGASRAVHHPSSRSSSASVSPAALAASSTNSASVSRIPPRTIRPEDVTARANDGSNGMSTPLSTLATIRSKPAPPWRAR